MKLLAQHGHGEGEKISDGLRKKLIEGVIFSPKDIKPDKLVERMANVRREFKVADIYFDPQIYASLYANDPRANFGKLEEYEQYFSPLSKNRLESERNVINVLEDSFDFQDGLDISGTIAPNILISRSFDSRESTIAKSFIRLAKEIYEKEKREKPLYATLVISRDALTNLSELEEFLNDITILEKPPDGFYIIVGVRNSESKMELFNSDVIAGWMLINYSLKVNGFKVMNGYSDLLSPLLGAVGGDIGATGWWSNLRTFSLERFLPSVSGGRLPVQRYLSTVLLNRIRFDEYQAWSEILPIVKNNLPHDKIYDDTASEPDRALEVLQSWEAIRELNNDLVKTNIETSLKHCEDAITKAEETYAEIEGVLRPDAKSNSDHIEPLREGLTTFRELAGL